MMEPNVNAVYVMVGGGGYEYPLMPGQSLRQLLDETAEHVAGLMEKGGVLVHRSNVHGGPVDLKAMVTIIRLAPGMAVNVCTGSVFKEIMREQRLAAMQAGAMPGPVPFGRG